MSFSWGKGELVRERIGEHVLEHLIPLRRLLDAGLRVGCGSDWGPKNVFEHIALAVEPTYRGQRRAARRRPGSRARRRSRCGRARPPTCCAGRGSASLEPGHHADLCVVDRDPLECAVEDLPGTEVRATLLGGEAVHGEL